eukprot:scaffold1759_cov284-Prasinococcus_capsulatus_cf.AAC.3
MRGGERLPCGRTDGWMPAPRARARTRAAAARAARRQRGGAAALVSWSAGKRLQEGRRRISGRRGARMATPGALFRGLLRDAALRGSPLQIGGAPSAYCAQMAQRLGFKVRASSPPRRRGAARPQAGSPSCVGAHPGAVPVRRRRGPVEPGPARPGGVHLVGRRRGVAAHHAGAPSNAAAAAWPRRRRLRRRWFVGRWCRRRARRCWWTSTRASAAR